MAVYSENDRQPIDELSMLWRNNSLVGDASLLHPDEFPSAWSEASIDDLNKRFWGNLLEGQEGGGKFESKWELQLSEASPEVRILAAECLLIYYLVTSSVGPERKIAMINRTIGPEMPQFHISGLPDGPTFRAYQALQQWISNPGQYYNTRQDIHVGYLMDFARRLKHVSADEREALLCDQPWAFAEFAAQGDRQSDAMRHILCHLLYPEHFERIASNKHKELVLKAFGGLSDEDEGASQDQQLYAIRAALKQSLPAWSEAQRDYYSPELEPIWRPVSKSVDDAALDPAFALEYKKQIVFYGPPGTGKTFRAGKLAESLIRTAAIQQWGVTYYFQNLELVNKTILENVTRLQMHPSYGYAEFMVGLQLASDGSTRNQLGALPRLIEKMHIEKEELGERALPHVLILDEINRTDLSTMFGEAFSAMERDKRDIEFDLFAVDENGQTLKFKIPKNLYIIGTMNEIDHSVEALDFALRRRFFWFATPYDEDDLITIWSDQWSKQNVCVPWNKAFPQLSALANSITQMNNKITELQDLGPEYELGAAVFSDLPYFIEREWRNRRHGRNTGKYLWDGNGKPLAPLQSLWSLSVQPVLAQYLSGSDRRSQQISELELFFTGQLSSKAQQK